MIGEQTDEAGGEEGDDDEDGEVFSEGDEDGDPDECVDRYPTGEGNGDAINSNGKEAGAQREADGEAEEDLEGGAEGCGLGGHERQDSQQGGGGASTAEGWSVGRRREGVCVQFRDRPYSEYFSYWRGVRRGRGRKFP
jgi:hypothetical protein